MQLYSRWTDDYVLVICPGCGEEAKNYISHTRDLECEHCGLRSFNR